MATLQIRYFTRRPRLDGSYRYYWQPSTELQKAGWEIRRLAENATGTADEIRRQAIDEAQRCNADLDRWYEGTNEKPPASAKQGSIEALIDDYKKSREYLTKTAKTQKGYDYAFRAINRWAGDCPVTAMSPKLVKKFYRSMEEKTPAKAGAIIRVLRLLFSYAVGEGMVRDNPARKLGIGSSAKKGLLWTPEAVELLVKTADAEGHFSIGTAIFLNAWLGQRKGDIINLPAAAYKNGVIQTTQSKTGAEVTLHVGIIPQLKRRLEEQLQRNRAGAVASTVLLPGPHGQPYSEYWFTHLFARIRGKAVENAGDIENLNKLIFKDLRHTAVTRLAEAGCTIPEIASITGHRFKSCEAIVDRYNIRTGKMAEEAFRRRLAAESQP